jgi:hypothetical protein
MEDQMGVSGNREEDTPSKSSTRPSSEPTAGLSKRIPTRSWRSVEFLLIPGGGRMTKYASCDVERLNVAVRSEHETRSCTDS